MTWTGGCDAKASRGRSFTAEEMEHPAAFAALLRYETPTVWTRDSWTRYRRPMKDKENTEWPLPTANANTGSASKPLVPFLFEPTSP